MHLLCLIGYHYDHAESGMPQSIGAKLIKESEGCVILLGWTPPVNRKISHYMIYVDETNVLNTTSDTDQNVTLISYLINNCETHNVSVSAVNYCGCESQKSPSVALRTLCDSGTGNFGVEVPFWHVCIIKVCQCFRRRHVQD